MIAQIPEETMKRIVELCQQHKVRELSLFGSRVRGDHSDASDYDFLIDFLPEAMIGLIEFSRIQIDLQDLVKTRVDLVPKDGLKPRIRDRILSEAKIVYAA